MAFYENEKKTIHMFYGHQFSSGEESSTKIRNAVTKASKAIESSWNSHSIKNKVNLILNKLDITSDSFLFEEVIKAIDLSDICIFNLTENNSNVLFELGHAHGREKSNIWICNEKISLDELPSDFQGKFLLRYKNETDLVSVLENEIQVKLERLFNSLGMQAYEELWDFRESSVIDLVFGAIPKEEQTKYADLNEPNFLRYQRVADIDSLVFISKMLSRNFPENELKDYIGNEYRKQLDAPTILVGGPALNSAARRYYLEGSDITLDNRIPVKFQYDEDSGEECIKYICNNETFSVTVNGSSSILDIGIFAKLYDKTRKRSIILISGIRTGGVLGAAKCFSDTPDGLLNCEILKNHDDDLTSFLAIFKVECQKFGEELVVETPNLGRDSLLILNPLENP